MLILLGAGLYLLALTQGLLLVVEGFWNLRHSLKEISSTERVTWHIGRAGVLLLGIGFGFGMCFLGVGYSYSLSTDAAFTKCSHYRLL